jgi:hypothetical protein
MRTNSELLFLVFLCLMLNLVTESAIADSVNVTSNCDDQSIPWSGHKLLTQQVNYTLDYYVNETEGRLYIKLRAQTTGFLGFGLSESGAMVGSDIVTAAIINNQPSVQDRFVPWDAYPFFPPTPKVDECNHWQTICGSEQNGFSEFILSRALDTKDPEDRKIQKGDMYIIFAWGEPGVNFVSYHGSRRGTSAVSFYNDVPSTFEPPAEADGSITLTINNYEITGDTTQYVLQKIDLGPDDGHIIAAEPIIRTEDEAVARKSCF